MFAITALHEATEKPIWQAELLEQLGGLIAQERDPIANCANAASLLFHGWPGLNWAGFYFLRPDGWLVLGPFQGKPACVRIGPGQGVCGAAITSRAPQCVPDVLAFPGHIACDAASRSELVVPLATGPRLLGVIDLDAPLPDHFDQTDTATLLRCASLLGAGCDW